MCIRDRFTGCEIRERATPAVAHRGHAPRMPDDVDRGCEVQKRLFLRDLNAVAAAFLRILLAVPELDAAPDAIVKAGRDGQVTGGRERVRHAADVMVLC